MPAPISQAAEDYLKAIFKLQHDSAAVSTNEIAAAMNVTPASATNMVKRLAKMDLLAHQSYRGVTLTAAGEKVALEVIRHHRLLELYLREVMGYDWAALHDEAEQLEHHISEDFEDRIDALLGHPTRDPHGDPIPTRAGEMARPSQTPLDAVGVDTACRIERLADHDPALLRRLEALGLLPGVEVTVRGVTHEGDILLRADAELHLSSDDAAHIFVSETTSAAPRSAG